jgi:hypothetical protein
MLRCGTFGRSEATRRGSGSGLQLLAQIIPRLAALPREVHPSAVADGSSIWRWMSFRQACLNRPGRSGTLAALEWEDLDACEATGTGAEGFAAGPQSVSSPALGPPDRPASSAGAVYAGRPIGPTPRRQSHSGRTASELPRHEEAGRGRRSHTDSSSIGGSARKAENGLPDTWFSGLGPL